MLNSVKTGLQINVNNSLKFYGLINLTVYNPYIIKSITFVSLLVPDCIQSGLKGNTV